MSDQGSARDATGEGGVPAAVQQAMIDALLDGRRAAWLSADPSGRVLAAGGDLAWHGIDAEPQALPGRRADEVCAALQGQFPFAASRGREVLPRLELRAESATDVILQASGDAVLCMFLCVTEEVRREQRFQQRGNELALLLRELGAAVFRRLGPGRFRLFGDGPRWLGAFGAVPRTRAVELGQVFPFLEPFFDEAESLWRRPRGITSSGTWTEEDGLGRDRELEAIAVSVDGGDGLLVVHAVDDRVGERRRLLQRAREAGLDHERLLREIDQKEVLLHCIVHDLKGPLSGMVGSMSLLSKRELSRDRTLELLELGLEQARAQEAMIRTVLEVFASEVEDLESFESEAAHAPDLVRVLRSTVERYVAPMQVAGARLELSIAAGLPETLPVVGRRDRMERVFSNLLENALRHAPEGSTVRVSVEAGEGAYLVTVEDEGPGVGPELVGQLFHRPLARRGRTGVAGLGLYFCHHVLETWGGHIAYQARDEGGACFRVRLVQALP